MSEVEGRLANRQFSEQIGKALQELGTEEAIACMARALVFIAHSVGNDLEFTCDQGVVSIERTGADTVKH